MTDWIDDSTLGKVSFGTSTDRHIFPVDTPKSRFGCSLKPIRGTPQLGPGCYNNDEHDFIREFNMRPRSKRGYIINARTAPRFSGKIDLVTPAPGDHQNTDPKKIQPAFKPFSTEAERFKLSKQQTDVTPGPGTYDNEVVSHQTVHYQQSFGGPPTNLPCIKQRSTIESNTEKLLTTKDAKRYNRRLAYLKLYY